MHLYREIPPHPALAGHIACLWTSHALPQDGPVRHRVLPDKASTSCGRTVRPAVSSPA
jgi:hypothetical protein